VSLNNPGNCHSTPNMVPPQFGYAFGDVYGPFGNLVKWAVNQHNNAQPRFDSVRQEVIRCNDGYRQAIQHNQEFGDRYSPQENFVLGQRAERVVVALERAQETAKVRPVGFREKMTFNTKEMAKAEVYLKQNRQLLETQNDIMAKNAEARQWRNNEYDNPPPYNREGDKYGNPGYGNAGYGNPGYGNPGYGNAGYSNAGDGNSGYGNAGYSNAEYGNPGYSNPGYGNAGYGNAGDGNSGYSNPGYGNAGYGNSGYGNPGYGNPEYRESAIVNDDDEYDL